MTNKIARKSISALTMIPIALPIYAFGWEAPTEISNSYEENKMKDQTNRSPNDIMSILDSGLANMNRDLGVLESNLTAEEAKTSPIIRLTRKEPVIMAVEDVEHDRAIIQAISSQRHSDGSATIKQKTISPNDFRRKSDGGMLNDKQYEIFISAYGGANPADVFNGQGDNPNTWYGTDPNVTQTMMGLIMQFMGATHGYYVLLEPDVRTWTTSSGGPFTKKITTHVEAHITPYWTFLTPLDIGTGYGAPNMPLFQIKGNDNQNYAVRGGVNAVSIGPTDNFNGNREFLDYRTRTESGFTGFALVFTAIAIGALTGGAGLVSMGAVGAGGVAGAAALTGLTISGAELHKPVAGDFGDLFLKSATAGVDTREKGLKQGFGNEWRQTLVDVVEDGPLEGKKEFNNQMRKELIQWDRIITPND